MGAFDSNFPEFQAIKNLRLGTSETTRKIYTQLQIKIFGLSQ